MSKELKDTITTAIGDLKTHVAGELQNFRSVNDLQFKVITEKLDGQKEISEINQKNTDRRLEDVESDQKNQRWFSGIVGLIAAALGFGGGKVIH